MASSSSRAMSRSAGHPCTAHRPDRRRRGRRHPVPTADALRRSVPMNVRRPPTRIVILGSTSVRRVFRHHMGRVHLACGHGTVKLSWRGNSNGSLQRGGRPTGRGGWSDGGRGKSPTPGAPRMGDRFPPSAISDLAIVDEKCSQTSSFDSASTSFIRPIAKVVAAPMAMPTPATQVRVSLRNATAGPLMDPRLLP